MDERLRFIADWRQGAWTFESLCEAYGISRKTGYKYVRRYQHEGLDGLKDRSRAPKNQPNRVDSEIIAAIVKARRSHPRWGPRKLLRWLSVRDTRTDWPSRSTVANILKREGLVMPRRRRKTIQGTEKPLEDGSKPNDLWCADFKGWFRTLDGSRCDPFTVTDNYSRFALKCKVVPRQKFGYVKSALEEAFKEYGLPWRFRTDNGAPFASRGLCGLSRLSVWLIRMGVRVERIDPASPQQNGQHERFHLTLKNETIRPAKSSIRAQQLAFTRFQREYNFERPHEALDDLVPGEIYVPSPRKPPRCLGEMEYPSHFELRRVRSNGVIKWRTKRYFLTGVLGGELVGIEPVDEDRWSVQFGPLELAVLDERLERLIFAERMKYLRDP